jgi:hypothetical protein
MYVELPFSHENKREMYVELPFFSWENAQHTKQSGSFKDSHIVKARSFPKTIQNLLQRRLFPDQEAIGQNFYPLAWIE